MGRRVDLIGLSCAEESAPKKQRRGAAVAPRVALHLLVTATSRASVLDPDFSKRDRLPARNGPHWRTRLQALFGILRIHPPRIDAVNATLVVVADIVRVVL